MNSAEWELAFLLRSVLRKARPLLLFCSFAQANEQSRCTFHARQHLHLGNHECLSFCIFVFGLKIDSNILNSLEAQPLAGICRAVPERHSRLRTSSGKAAKTPISVCGLPPLSLG